MLTLDEYQEIRTKFIVRDTLNFDFSISPDNSYWWSGLESALFWVVNNAANEAVERAVDRGFNDAFK